jgi:Protein of unknown function (DUF4239)
MFYWIYDIPTWTVAVLFAATFVGVSWFGAIFVCPLLRRFFPKQAGWNDIVGYFLSFFGVIYGLLLGLLAVATYQNLPDVDKTVALEATSLASLYRDVSSYPEPNRTELHDLLREYTRYVIEEAWPLQRKGIVPAGGIDRITTFQARLTSFEPQTKGQEALHAEALRQYNNLLEHRRMRLYSVETSIPPFIWYTVVVGALINMFLVWMFDIGLNADLVLGGLIAFFTSTMFCLIAIMDNPYRGDFSVSPKAFQLIYDGLMKKPTS